MSFVLESGCKGIAFWLTNQIFSQKSCLKTCLFNTCLQLVQVKPLIYLINIRMRARGCVRAHTHRLHVWQVMRYMEHGSCLFEHGFLFFLNTNFIFSNTNFIFLNTNLSELNESWCLRDIVLTRIKRIVMNGTGTRNYSKGSHTDLTDLTDFLMQGRIDGMKRIFRKRNFSWKTDGIFMR